ncbi:hypothetical protein MFFC18_16710 [Mariniblastus fucicola]|uniref:Uncharacterized protein n=1 Tax=Mariniblastus fucicola TaxID=980251 RepID=A0A5B9PA29_9BACT|nr:hypothetical protein MFFC18_16710 [Mariniblastus fucicola]
MVGLFGEDSIVIVSGVGANRLGDWDAENLTAQKNSPSMMPGLSISDQNTSWVENVSRYWT